jgi:hypothetical protein
MAGVSSGELREVEADGAPRFEEEAGTRGLVFANRSRGVTDREGVPRIYHPGTGLSARDVDGDGLEDLLLVGGGDLRLFHNKGGRFRDETAARGIVTPPQGECRCGIFGDVDGDGDPDLFVAVVEGDDLLFLNDGDGRFEQVPLAERGLSSTRQATGACFADFDRDGDLDLFVACGMNLMQVEPDPIYDAKNGTANRYYRNLGGGRFEDATEEAGVGDPGWALACTTADVDQDGDTDLFVANDFGRDMLYRNRGDGTFEDASDEAGLTYRTSSMSADFGDLNGDGLPDLLVSGMGSNSRWIVRMPGFPARGPFPISLLLRTQILDTMWEMLHGNRFFLSQPSGVYAEASAARGIHDQEWAWGSVWFDVDNDGDLDCYGVNGFWSGDEPDDL